LGATLAHYDFGNAIGDSFTEQVSASWNFARIERNPGGVLDFIVFYNPSPFSVDVTLTAYQTGVTPVSNTQTVGAQRRGGFSITDMPELPTGVLSVVLTARATSTSNQAAFEGIVASLSHYTADGSAGFGVLGDPDGGATSGAVTNLMQGATSRSEAVFFNPGSSTATVSIAGSYLRGSLPEFTRTLTIVAGGQIVLTSADLGLTAEEPAGLRYTSTQPISVMSDVIQSGDADASTAAGVAGTRFLFGDAFMDPNLAGDKFFETLYIFNPAAATGNVTVKLEFTDGTSASFNVSVASRRFAEVKLHERPELTTRTGPTWFSMEVSTGTAVGGGTPFMITLTHYDLLLGGGWATTPVPVGFVNDIALIPV
jgi:environmental stress-induced protein Ves